MLAITRRMSVLSGLVLALLMGCHSSASYSTRHTTYKQLPSANFGERVKAVVIHYTAIDYAESTQVLVEPDGLSSHYLIPESADPTYSGTPEVLQLVSEHQRAWHAGRSFWQGRENLNDQSIGIELVNVPTCHWQPDMPLYEQEPNSVQLCDFPVFDNTQITLLIGLLSDITQRYPDIPPTAIVGHADIAFMRKTDPGPKFPWFRLYQAGIGAWFEPHIKQKYWLQFNASPLPAYLFQQGLQGYGYGVQLTGQWDEQTLRSARAFNLHFLPHKPVALSQPDGETQGTLLALLIRYLPTQANALLTDYYRHLNDPDLFTPASPCMCDVIDAE